MVLGLLDFLLGFCFWFFLVRVALYFGFVCGLFSFRFGLEVAGFGLGCGGFGVVGLVVWFCIFWCWYGGCWQFVWTGWRGCLRLRVLVLCGFRFILVCFRVRRVWVFVIWLVVIDSLYGMVWYCLRFVALGLRLLLFWWL